MPSPNPKGSAYEKYLRHGKQHGADKSFWKAARSDLDERELQRLALSLGVKLPKHPAVLARKRREKRDARTAARIAEIRAERTPAENAAYDAAARRALGIAEALPPKQAPEVAPQAGSPANNAGTEPVGRTPVVSSAEGPVRACRECDRALPPKCRTGLCRTCYQRELMRQRRAG